jgi:dual specificity phosphatase 3
MAKKQATTAVRFEPMQYWRKLCWATPQIVLSGDLPEGAAKARVLDQWIAAGITHIIDTRLEHSDQKFVAAHAPDMGYTWVGVDDHGGRQPDTWFAEGVEAAQAALAAPDGKVLIHCHMGVNRGPSMGFAAMLATGLDPLTSLEMIREARPIAAVMYAEDAVGWFHRSRGSDAWVAENQTRAVREWLVDNPIDSSWINSRTWRQGA